MITNDPYEIYSLGDSALTIQFGNSIDRTLNQKVFRLFHYFKKNTLAGIRDCIPAYCSLTIVYDLTILSAAFNQYPSVYEGLKQYIEDILAQPLESIETETRLVKIPVCYGGAYGPDMETLVTTTGIHPNEVIYIHSSRIYTVYMMGFLPGFAYLSPVDERIKMHRKPQPQPVKAGGVGIAGIQTGIYPLQSPGGWQIIGQTPLQLFQKNTTPPVLLQPGDAIQFYPITDREFQNY